MFTLTDEHLVLIANHPQILGHLAGKDKLTQMHGDWILDAWRAEDHYAIQAHRGSYKTTALTEIGCIWWLLFHPNDRIGLVRKPYNEAAKTLVTIKKYMDLETIQAVFYYAHGIIPKAMTKKENQLIYNFKKTVTKEGSIDAYAPDGSLTGNHYDKIIMDDVVTLKDRLSKAEREKTKEAVREIMTNIIDPGKQVISIGTPWHKDDAHALLPPNQKFDCYQTNILTEEQIQKKRDTTTGILFAANYELRHDAPDDMIFQSVADEAPWLHGSKVYAHLDAKFSGNHFCALTLMAERADGRLQIKGWVFEENVKEKIKWIQDICKSYKVKSLYIETNPDKGYTADILEQGENSVHCERYQESTNKHNKIISYLKGRWMDLVWDIDCQPEYLEQILDFREGQEPDDAPDSAASLIRARFAENKNKKSILNEW